jgi:hypothetical protein
MTDAAPSRPENGPGSRTSLTQDHQADTLYARSPRTGRYPRHEFSAEMVRTTYGERRDSLKQARLAAY